MLELSSREDLGTARTAGRRRPSLRMTWVLDPETGKPVARWLIEGTEPAGSFAFASAA
jgi:hypothetical protein